MSEAATQRLILDWLAAERHLAFRMNTGAMSAEHNGKKRFMRFGTPGMADILAFPVFRRDGLLKVRTVWIEVKSDKGRQSDTQKSFQQQVEESGHVYILARSLDDVMEVLR